MIAFGFGSFRWKVLDSEVSKKRFIDLKIPIFSCTRRLYSWILGYCYSGVQSHVYLKLPQGLKQHIPFCKIWDMVKRVKRNASSTAVMKETWLANFLARKGPRSCVYQEKQTNTLYHLQESPTWSTLFTSHQVILEIRAPVTHTKSCASDRANMYSVWSMLWEFSSWLSLDCGHISIFSVLMIYAAMDTGLTKKIRHGHGADEIYFKNYIFLSSRVWTVLDREHKCLSIQSYP
jgi:hypothetical protein